MRFDLITLFPEMIEAIAGHGILGRAIEDHKITLYTWNPRDYTTDRHRTVDDRPYGGGPGMVMKYAPLAAAIQSARQAHPQPARVIYLSPQGKRLEQNHIKMLATRERVILIAGRYEGIDERVIELEIDEEWSIGDYILSGGELPAMVLVDAITRTLPGVLGHACSAEEDSFSHGLLDHPHYTRPEHIAGLAVPDILLSGHHAKICDFRLKESLRRTWRKRPELLVRSPFSRKVRQLLGKILEEETEKTK